MIAKFKKPVRCCRECSTPLTGHVDAGTNKPHKRGKPQIFCTILCKATWNNRRKNRGADIYDLWMALRHSRAEATANGVWAEMCRLSEQWNNEDKDAGRRTYEHPAVVITRLKDRGAIRRGPINRV